MIHDQLVGVQGLDALVRQEGVRSVPQSKGENTTPDANHERSRDEAVDREKASQVGQERSQKHGKGASTSRQRSQRRLQHQFLDKRADKSR
jgi:hypothetical protein